MTTAVRLTEVSLTAVVGVIHFFLLLTSLACYTMKMNLTALRFFGGAFKAVYYYYK